MNSNKDIYDEETTEKARSTAEDFPDKKDECKEKVCDYESSQIQRDRFINLLDPIPFLCSLL